MMLQDRIFNDYLIWSSEGKSLEMFEKYDKKTYLLSEKYKDVDLEQLATNEYIDAFLESAEFNRLDRLKYFLKTPFVEYLMVAKDLDGYSALHRAAYNGNVDAAKLLIEYGANVNACTDDGWTPLHCACKWGNMREADYNVEMVRLLLLYEADASIQSESKLTPLHIAALNRKQDTIIKILLKEPSTEIDVRNSLGYRAEDIAQQMGCYYDVFKNKN